MNSNGALILNTIIEQLAEAVADRVAQVLEGQRERRPAAEPNFISEGEVARRYGLRRRTLQGWRLRGGGPAWVRAGRRVLYPVAGIEEFLTK
jgi:hypothetical protein